MLDGLSDVDEGAGVGGGGDDVERTISPDILGYLPSRHLASVDLPDFEGPMNVVISPGGAKSAVTFLSAYTRSSDCQGKNRGFVKDNCKFRVPNMEFVFVDFTTMVPTERQIRSNKPKHAAIVACAAFSSIEEVLPWTN